LQSLVEKSLVRKTNDRFWLLETIREYADERLGAYGEIDPLHRRHADWFLEQAQRLWASSGRPTHARMAEELALDQHNLAAGTLWALDAGEAELALAYGEALWEFWHIRGQGGEGVRLLTSIVENSEGVASSARAWSLFGLGVLKRARGDFEAAFALHQQSLELFRALGDRDGQSAALLDCGVDLTNAGDAAAAESHFAQALAAAREAGDERILGYALNNFAWLLSREPGRDNEAFELVTEGIDRLGAVGDRWGVACAVGTLADLHLKRGELDEPERLFRQQLAAGAEFRSIVVIAEALRGLACIATRRDQLPDAARLFGHADQLLQDAELDTGGTIDDAAERETARAGLGVDEYEALRAQGGGLGLDELVPASVGAQ
jgi:tetratricopeptide (TPR) repeat protein